MGNKRDFTGAVEKAADEIFGKAEAPASPPASPNLIARPISIHEITPDPKQPRRLLPGSLRYDRPLAEVLGDWLDMANAEADRAIPVALLLMGNATERSQDNDDRVPGHIEADFMKLVNLATTIRRDGGLINPVTIYRTEDGYRLETGERRWLAHHLLQAVLGEPQWHRISAREVTAPSIWRQAHENTARDDLNAISLARQLALLVMDIYQEKGAAFEPYEYFGFDRHFYAQVADGFEFPVAYGDRERIIAAMGKSNVSQVNQFRALLRLPDEVWQTADDENSTEYALRDFVKTLRSEAPTPVIEQESESITAVRDHSNIQAQESPAEAEAIKPASEPSDQGENPAVTLPQKLFDWAYRFSAAALNEDRTWFSSNNAGTPPEVLNRFIEQGYLEGRKTITNQDRYVAFYRTTPMAWDALEYEPLDFSFTTAPNNLPPGADRPGFTGNLTRPRSGGEVHAGTGSNIGSPPRRVTQQLFDKADRLAITTAANLTDKRLDTADGLQDAITTLQRSMVAQQRKLDMLLLRQRA